jgi:hypothetical protein
MVDNTCGAGGPDIFGSYQFVPVIRDTEHAFGSANIAPNALESIFSLTAGGGPGLLITLNFDAFVLKKRLPPGSGSGGVQVNAAMASLDVPRSQNSGLFAGTGGVVIAAGLNSLARSGDAGAGGGSGGCANYNPGGNGSTCTSGFGGNGLIVLQKVA